MTDQRMDELVRKFGGRRRTDPRPLCDLCESRPATHIAMHYGLRVAYVCDAPTCKVDRGLIAGVQWYRLGDWGRV